MRRFVLFLLVSLLFCASRAQAQLDFNLTPAGQTGPPGSTLTFDATLTNAGSQTIFLNGVQDLGPPELNIDSSPFFNNTPLDLLSGDSWTGPIFDVTVDPLTQPGSYTGSFTVVGGADGNATDALATQNFQVNVPASAPVPEPAFYQMGALLALGAIGVIRRRRRNVIWGDDALRSCID